MELFHILFIYRLLNVFHVVSNRIQSKTRSCNLKARHHEAGRTHESYFSGYDCICAFPLLALGCAFPLLALGSRVGRASTTASSGIKKACQTYSLQCLRDKHKPIAQGNSNCCSHRGQTEIAPGGPHKAETVWCNERRPSPQSYWGCTSGFCGSASHHNNTLCESRLRRGKETGGTARAGVLSFLLIYLYPGRL